ncbi:hypothetical protein CEXT_42711 [Caerostris extrusa]|uniref:Uncharacterized protein n=1 Tax=Caerostris extrusa TaxID=172846 RepID=A0AAV4QZP2_CAEEX|nr:hypothetical protein CEXT_42711 [Caerostris extrusa]
MQCVCEFPLTGIINGAEQLHLGIGKPFRQSEGFFSKHMMTSFISKPCWIIDTRILESIQEISNIFLFGTKSSLIFESYLCAYLPYCNVTQKMLIFAYR